MEGHAQAMKLSSNENRLVQYLTRLNVKPRDILSTLKKQMKKNVSILKTIYNAHYKFRKTEQASRTPMQNLMNTLQSKGYVFYYRVHDITNELEELFFVHPTSLTIWQAFPNVVLMDATYKTNKYNLPFFEIVGVTSTNKTFSIAFAFINKEKANNYIWALTRLQLTINDSFCPRVIVTDRDLALMKACAEVFPQSNHLLCRWHIQNDIIKHCRPRIRSQQTWVHFLWMWNILVTSPTNTAYMQNYVDLQALLFEYPDKHINFGNSTTNRVESQHAKLKKHLDTAKCDLDRFIHAIEDIVNSQETAIKDSIERSRHIRKKKYNYPIFQQLHNVVSHHTMKIFLAEIHRSRDYVLTVDNCGCQIRSCFGLPCAHELAMVAIPFECIDPFWTKLDLLPSVYVEYGDLGYEKDMELFK
ncbi:protein FAR-RED ELONGATED HYPOCOTYL 3-like [Helianthus annuus]|uniref:protein FAR-RED ELONGATED HYPOCOTYL 3-like n=1 Tax=Helianthus annuus TaxID=4232 RepID=UPI000B9039D9|nr:protein FAR-RED ELONGATED HYPOCOTYL 3-like [Helianthus annuus]